MRDKRDTFLLAHSHSFLCCALLAARRVGWLPRLPSSCFPRCPDRRRWNERSLSPRQAIEGAGIRGCIADLLRRQAGEQPALPPEEHAAYSLFYGLTCITIAQNGGDDKPGGWRVMKFDF